MEETREAAFMSDRVIQKISVIDCLEEIEADGLYAVFGFDHPVYVAKVTSYIERRLSEEYPEMVFFTGYDGVRRCAQETEGRFI